MARFAPPDLSDLRMYVPSLRDESQGIPPEEPTMNSYESVPTTWDDACDDAFFRITSHLFSARFVAAATTLLVTNDSEYAPVL